MTTHHTAQGLASLGRHGDTMLVHMSPHEVAGLNYLAKKQGTKLTVNPETGLPEAFSLGGLFSSLLPMFAGAMMPASFGAMAPLLAGAATGGALAAAKGENPLMGGIMGGLGGYGGGNLANTLGAAANPLSTAGGWVPGKEIAQTALPNAVGMADSGALSTIGGAGNIGNPALSSATNTIAQSGFANSALSGSGNIIDPALNRLSQAGTGLKNIATGQPGAWDAFKAAGGTPTQLAMPVGGAILGGLEPSDIYGEPIKPSTKGKYDPYATLNLSGDTGLRLYAGGGTVTTGGLRDLYNTTDNITNPQLSRDGYGIGRLNSLAQQQSLNQAQTMGYADGGDVSMNLEALPSLNLDMINMPKATTETTPRSTASDMFHTGPANANIMLNRQKGSLAAITPSPVPKSYALNLNTGVQTPQYAMGGPVSFADGGDANKEALGLAPIDQSMGIASLTPIVPNQAMSTNQVQNAATALSGAQNQPTSDDGSIITQVATKLQQNPNYQPANPIEASIIKQIKGTDDQQGQTQQGQTQQGLGSLGAQPSQPMAPTFNASQPIAPTYYAGMNAPRGFADGGDTSLNLDQLPTLNLNTSKDSNQIVGDSGFAFNLAPMMNTLQVVSKAPYLPVQDIEGNIIKAPNPMFAGRPKAITGAIENVFNNMAKGGYLDGQGDGMSDSIPATIEGKQPARLADGEFVVPADVVSHLGNGSSKAGSKRLYAMLDKVRKARTGHTKQGKEINPNKYMPA